MNPSIPPTFIDARRASLDVLAPAERALADAFPTEKRRTEWALGRVAAKDAVRALLAAEGRPAPAPGRIVVVAGASGAPLLQVEGDASPGSPLAVSISHGHGHAAAWALRAGPAGGLPGVDLELVKPRKEGTLRFYLSVEERERVLALPAGQGDQAGPRDDLAIRLWAVKEAAFKALQPPRGMGLLDVVAAVDDAGGARVAYKERLQERAAALGVREVRAGWERRGDLVLAWVEAVGGAV